MRAAGIDEYGGAVRQLERPEPREPGPGELVVHVDAAGVANWDDIVRRGEWDTGCSPPMALGVEFAGTVAAAGSGVSEFAPGDVVMGHPVPLLEDGCWADYVLVPAELVAGVPAGIAAASAATFPVPALTAHQVVHEVAQVQRGDAVFVHGGGGVTGGLVTQIAVRAGARVTTTAGAGSRARVASWGAEAVFDYADPAWRDGVIRSVGRADVVVNAVRGGEPDAIGLVRDAGRFATLTGAPPPADDAVTVANVYVRADGPALRELAQLLAAGELQAPQAKLFELGRTALALEAAVAGHGAIAVAP